MKRPLFAVTVLLFALPACEKKADQGTAPGADSGVPGVAAEAQKPAPSEAPKGAPVEAPRTAAPAAPGVGPRKVVAIAAGDGAACAAMDDGKVRCWGRNDVQERGTPRSDDDAATPVEVPGVADATGLVMGGDPGSAGDVVCATTKAGAVWCWGHQRLIPGAKDGAPRAVAELQGVTQIATGGGTIYALKPDGTILGWGSPAFNAINTGKQGSSDLPPTPIAGVTGAKAVAAGQNHACALLADETVTCWGYPRTQQEPTVVEGLTGVKAIFAQTQTDESCALLADKTVTCWGAAAKARPVDGLAGVSKMAGRTHWCALSEDGVLSCWGNNMKGQVGHTRAASTSKAEKVEGLPGKVIDVAAGLQFTCAALADGQAACWGFNQRGQLGDGTLMDRATPRHVSAITLASLPAPRDGLTAVQEGPTPTGFEGLPEGCKTGALKVKLKGYEGETFAVKGAQARSQLGGKTIEILLADHNLDAGWNPPRGKQGRLGLRLARFVITEDKREPVEVDLGEYTLGTKVERVVAPSMALKNRNVMLASISLEGVDAGKLTLTHLDESWVCGELALRSDGSSIDGPFAAPIVK
jgi:alpha-tubulin suppressor-like RCC1 family protein